jgi:hypothetical protein
MLFDVEIGKVIDPVVYTGVLVVVSHSFGMKIEDVEILFLCVVKEWMKGRNLV